MSHRIAIVSDYYYPQLGGITEQVHGQARELTRRGHEVTVVVPRPLVVPRTIDPEPPHADFEIKRIGVAYPSYVNGSETLQTLSPRVPFALDRLFRERVFDVVHVHNPFGVMFPMSAIMRSRAPATVATTHSVVPPNYRLLRAFARPLGVLMRRVDAHIAVSNAVVDSFRPYFPQLEFEVIANAVDTSFFSPDAEPLSHLAGRRTVLFVGRFDPRNGLKHMLEVFIELRSKRSDVQLVVLGDGPLRPLLKRLVPAELEADVRFEGRVNRLRPRYLASAEIFCTPCRLASFGMVVLEAMSSGIPVVATRLPGFAEVMQDRVHGLMVDDPDDVLSFVSALDTLLDDPGRARALGRAGRDRVVSTFAWSRVGDSLEELYDRLLGSRRRHRSTSAVASRG
jgi:phosphatidylinositol alpha-mannosyltransferase